MDLSPAYNLVVICIMSNPSILYNAKLARNLVTCECHSFMVHVRVELENLCDSLIKLGPVPIKTVKFTLSSHFLAKTISRGRP